MAKVLSTLAIILGLLFASGQAHAQNPPPPQCNAGPINYNGDVDIAPSGSNDCIINGDVTATGYIRINAPLGKIQVTGNITASNHGNVILSAGSTVEVGGSIVVNNASASLGQAGSVDVKANSAGSGPAFVIGSASSNGVAGTINTDTALGGGNDPFFVRGGIRIRNRNDITLTSASALSVKGTASRSGVIILEAVDGNLSLPTGTLSADGQTGQSAGAIVLQAHTITTQDGTIVSASDSVGQASHFVNIAASSVSFQGSTGLTIRANGGGSTANGTGSFAYALPEFGIFVTDDSTTNPQNFTWTVTYPFGTAYPGGLTWNGAVGSPLNFTANGTSHTQVLMTGYPLVFNGGDLLLAARGQEDHRIDLTYTGSTSGINGLVVNANKLTLNANANANAGLGGDIFVSIPRPTSASPQQVLFTADGPASASANGGTVQFFPKGDVTLGGNAGQFHLSAQSGSLGGNGGRATVSNKPFTTELASNTAVQVTARGQNGDGGYLELRSLFANFNGTGLKLAADATGSGKGGELILDVDGPITVGSGFGAVKLSAEADATVGSDGGKITVISGSSADITSGQLSVKSGPTGSGGQLDLTIGGSLSLTGSLKADAGLSGNGRGGLVKVDAGDLVLNGSTTGGGQSLSADGAGTGAGGSVTAIIQASSHPTIIAGQQQGALSLSANGGKDAMGAFLGAGGVLQLTDLNEGFIITGGALDVKSGPGQNAGSILVDAGTTLAVSGDIKAVGTGNGAHGGTIRLTAQSDNDIVFSGTGPTNIIADGGQNGTTGNGGQITISNTGIGSLVFQNQVVLSAAAEGSNGGTAGKVSATTAGNLVFGGAASKVKASGGGVPGVTNIKLDAAGDIKIGSSAGEVELLAQGASPGARAGTVELSSQGEILVDGVRLKVKAGANGNGGAAIATGRKITVNGDFEVSGQGTGNGGTISLKATDPSGLTLNGSLSANGGQNGGRGGSIDLFYAGSAPLIVESLTANGTGSSTAGGDIRIHHTSNNDVTVSIFGSVETTTDTTNDFRFSGSFKVLPFDSNTNNISLTIQPTGNLASILSAEGKSILVTSHSSVTFGIETLKANEGGVGVSTAVRGSIMVVQKPSSSISATTNVLVITTRLVNHGTITGPSVSIQGGDREFTVVNSGTIVAGTAPGDLLEISLVSTILAYDIDISGGGTLAGNNVSLIATGSAGMNVIFSGSQNIRATSDDSLVLLSPTGGITVASGSTVEASSLPGGTDFTLKLEARSLINEGNLKSSGRIEHDSNIDPSTGSIRSLVISGGGNIFANNFQTYGLSVNIQQNSIRNSNDSGAGRLTGTTELGSWSAVISNGDVLLGTITAFGGDLSATTQNGDLIVGNQETVETLLQGNTTLRAGNGNIALGKDANIRATNGDVAVSLAGVPANACQDSGGGSDPCRPQNTSVMTSGTGVIYWGQPTPVGFSPENHINAAGQRIAFDRNNEPFNITLNGNVTVAATTLP